VVVGSPAHHLAMRQHGASVTLTRRNIDRCGPFGQVHSHRRGGAAVTVGVQGRVAELAVVVCTPTQQRRLTAGKVEVAGDGAAEVLTQGDGACTQPMQVVIGGVLIVADAVTVRIHRR